MESLKKEQAVKEAKALSNIERNSKVLHTYAKRLRKKKTEIWPFLDGEEYINDPKVLCDMLLQQYNSVFSTTQITEINDEIFNTNEENDLTDIIVNQQAIREAINELRSDSAAGPDGVPAIFLKQTASSISKPLAMLLRQSLDESSIAEIHKLAYITPLHKGGSTLQPKNYRLVSLTSHIIKVFERVIKKNIMKHLIEHHLINKEQHGFVPGRSTQTQLLVHFETIYEALITNSQIDIVYLDFAKAFDKVSHKIVIEKMLDHKISGKIGRWIKEFLLHRKQKVVANGVMSKASDVLSGVPQGTVLAALLFLIMISDIDKDTQDAIVRCFVDDTRVRMKIKNEGDREKLQRDLQRIYEWAEKNCMEFNGDKFEMISHGKPSNDDNRLYKGPNGEEIKEKQTIKDLGIVINEKSDFSDHITKTASACKAMSGFIMRTFKTRSTKPLLMLYKTYIRSKAEYCNLVWSPHTQKEVAIIESIQRSYTAKMQEVQHLDYWDRLKELKLYSLERRRERFMIIYAWQQIEGIRDNILGLTVSARSIDGRGRLLTPKHLPWNISKKNRSIIHEATASKMVRLFNILPREIRNLTNISTEAFKRRLDRLLANVPDEPRLDDDKYSRRTVAASDSLVHQARNVRECGRPATT